MRYRPARMRGWIALVGVAIAISASADLENNQLYTSRADHLRVVVPRGWRATDQPSYPGLLLWMVRNDADGEVHVTLTAQAFTREVFCSWPITCRTLRDATLPAKAACALGIKLGALGCQALEAVDFVQLEPDLRAFGNKLVV